MLLAHFNVNYKAKLSSSTFLFYAYAVLSAARTFETQIDSLPRLYCDLFRLVQTKKTITFAYTLKCQYVLTASPGHKGQGVKECPIFFLGRQGTALTSR